MSGIRFTSPLSASLLALMMLGQVFVAHAQQPAPALTRVQDVLALRPDNVNITRAPVRLRGVVVDVSPRRDDRPEELSLHDGVSALSMTLPETLQAPALGNEVEIEGSAYSENFEGQKRIRVEAALITLMGTGELPKPFATEVTKVHEFKHLDQWVSLEGVVLQTRFSSPVLTIQLSTEQGYCNALVRNWPKDNVPKDWVGGAVRVTGLNKPYTNTPLFSVIVPSPAQVNILKPGVVNPFDAPLTTATALQKAAGPISKRYKLAGTVLNVTASGVTYLRGTDGAGFSLYQLFPLDEDTSGRLSTPVEKPRTFSPGDVVEVVGTPAYIDPGVHLNFSQVRFIQSGPAPEPLATDIGSVLTGKSINNLVELHGRLITLDDVGVTPARFRTTLKIEDSGKTILAFVDSPKRGALADLQPDHLLKLRAIVSGHPHFPEIRLWLPTTRDAQSLGVASAVMARRIWTWVGISAACMIPLFVWVFMLRRSRTTIRELNASLEKRVEERTAELAAAKDDLSKALSQERDLNELKTRFITMVSHEFRTPLGITMSAVELMRHYSERLAPEKQTELLEDIHGATLRMSGLMEQVLVLGRVEAGKTAYRPAPVNLVEFCGKLTDEGLSATSHRCPVNFKAEGDFTGAHADESLMRHIFSNLISNAVKYSPEGAPVDFNLHRENGHAVFTVQDRGIGIPEADKSMLFEAFHRASNVGEIAGTGLGLLLVKRCVELHQGSIAFQSAEGKGTTFTVKLPVEEQE